MLWQHATGNSSAIGQLLKCVIGELSQPWSIALWRKSPQTVGVFAVPEDILGVSRELGGQCGFPDFFSSRLRVIWNVSNCRLGTRWMRPVQPSIITGQGVGHKGYA